jgi:hypothetical protein
MELQHGTTSISPAKALRKVTGAIAGDLPEGPARGLLVGTAGTATFKDGTQTTCTDVPLQEGYNPLGVAGGLTLGTAANVWLLY